MVMKEVIEKTVLCFLRTKEIDEVTLRTANSAFSSSVNCIL